MHDEKDFIWDENKNEINIKKHGISFNEAWTVFNDEFILLYPDDEHSYSEERFIAIGESVVNRLLMVCYCERENTEIVRLISARKADKQEIELYYGGIV
ncbi:MAG: BrnT family toxin [Oscillospiraceae bacterium]|nr:BrnT family toxin [Oscillospiraceae bacterium]